MKETIVSILVVCLLLSAVPISMGEEELVDKSVFNRNEPVPHIPISIYRDINSEINGVMERFNIPTMFSKEVESISASLPNFNKPEFVPGEFIVKFKSDISAGDLSVSKSDVPKIGILSIDTLNKKYDVSNIQNVFEYKKGLTFQSSDFSKVYKFTISNDEDIFSLIKEYGKDPNVEYAEPNYIYHTCVIPNDPYLNRQWALHNTGQTGGTIDADIDAPEAWDVETGGSDVVIAIVDSGVDYSHPDLADNIWVNPGEDLNGNGIVDPVDFDGIDNDNNGFIDDIRGWDFAMHNNDPKDDYGHGTHCSGIASAVTNNGVGVAGICWNCKIMPIKISFGSSLFTDAAANGIIYAADNGADVISMSWGGHWISLLIKDALDYAFSKGVVLAAAAGNGNSDMKLYPSAFDNVIAVAATDHNDDRAGFTNYGEWVDVAAPGVDIYSTLPGNSYDYKSGTSMACPYVAGLAALFLSKNQEQGISKMVKNVIRLSADEIDSPVPIGSGRINAYQALLKDPPIAFLDPIPDWTDVKGIVEITGGAYGNSFQYYTVEYGRGREPELWVEITNLSDPIQEGTLALLDTTSLDDSLYTIRLKVVCNNGDVYDVKIVMIVNNEYNLFIVDDDGGQGIDYTIIQEAVDDAGRGDSIYVHNGIYYENIQIDKSITLAGENKDTTIIDGGGSSDVVYVSADLVNLSGFTIRNGKCGIFLYYYSRNISIEENNISYNECGIVSRQSSNNINISRNTFSNNSIGIVLDGGGSNKVYHNIINSSANYGIYLNSSNNIISGNTFFNDGIFIFSSCHNTISDNTVNGRPLVYMENESDMLFEGDAGQIILSGCNNIVIQNQDLSNTSIGIELVNTDNCLITNNRVSDNYAGILLFDFSCYNTISENIVNSNYFSDIDIEGFSNSNLISNNIIKPKENDSYTCGVVCYYVSNNTLADNTVSNNFYGVAIYYSSNITIEGNTVSGNEYGIEIFYSDNIIVERNEFLENQFGVGIGYSSNNVISVNSFIHDGIYFSYTYQNTVNGNIVNNKPLIYLEGESDTVVDDEAGQIILVSCENITIRNQDLSYTFVGIQLLNTSNCLISDNILSSNNNAGLYLESSKNNQIIDNIVCSNDDNGICLYESISNTISDNIILDNGDGIWFSNSNNNIIRGNNISNNGEDGISFLAFQGFGLPFQGICNNNIISDNTISSNTGDGVSFFSLLGALCNNNIISNNTISSNTESSGIRFIGLVGGLCSNNTVCHNNFINNTQNAYDDGGGTNYWDNGYPSGGNYWDDYTGVDNYQGPNQDIPGSDGIGDTPYDILGGSNQDNYPLMEPYDITNTPPNKPNKPSGPTTGKAGKEYTYTTNTTDPDGDDVYYWFDWGDDSNSGWLGPYASGEICSASHIWTEDGAYEVRVQAMDSLEFISDWSDSLIVSVGLIPPVADANGPYTGTAGESVHFDGSDSYDPDGTIVNYEWDFGDGESGSGVNPTHTYDTPDTYTVILTVEDDDGLTDTDTTTATILHPPPVADANGPYEGVVGIPVDFTGSASDGVPPYSYYWSFGDNVYSHAQNPSHKYKQPGTYSVSLKVTDNINGQDTDSTYVIIRSPETLVADAGGPYSGGVDQVIAFTGNAVGGVSPYTFEWDLDNDGDYDDATGQSASKSWSTIGTYTIGLKVTDNIGTTDTDTAQVSITSHAPNKPSKPSGPTSGKAGTEYTYTSSTTDPDDDDVFYLFDWDDGTDSGWLGPYDSGDAVTASHTWTEEGDYQIKVKAKDEHGAESEWSDPLSATMPVVYEPEELTAKLAVSRTTITRSNCWVTFDASGSTPTTGNKEPVLIRWDIDGRGWTRWKSFSRNKKIENKDMSYLFNDGSTNNNNIPGLESDTIAGKYYYARVEIKNIILGEVSRDSKLIYVDYTSNDGDNDNNDILKETIVEEQLETTEEQTNTNEHENTLEESNIIIPNDPVEPTEHVDPVTPIDPIIIVTPVTPIAPTESSDSLITSGKTSTGTSTGSPSPSTSSPSSATSIRSILPGLSR